MTKEEYQKKIDEICNQIAALYVQREQVKKEFQDDTLRKLEEQGITPGTKVFVKTEKWKGNEIETETYFYGVSIVWGEMRHVFHRIKQDGTMSQIKQYIEGSIISIHKI